MPQHLDQAAAPAAEYEQMPAVRITPQRLLHQQRQTIKALAHIRVAGRQPNPRAARDRDHRRPLPLASAFINADTVEASTAPVIRIRPPPANSISITPAVSCDPAGAADAGSGKTATGENVACSAGTHSSRRQRNNWLA